MKKFISVIIMMCLTVSVFAGYHDSYAYMWEDPSYVTLIDALKENDEPSVVKAAYGSYISGPARDAEECLTELHMVRYYMDRGMQSDAERHYERMEHLYETADFRSGTEKLTAEFDLLSAEYYIWHDALGAGLRSSNVGKELFKADPYEYRVAVSEGFRLLSTPHIAGGSPKRGLKLFREIEPYSDGMNRLDRFSLYSGLGMAAYERKEYDASKEYFRIATSIYPADPAMQEYLRKLEER